MIKLLKKRITHWLTFFKYSRVLRGGNVLIKNSEISQNGVVIFGHVIITGSTLKQHTSIHSFSVVTGTTLNGNKIGNSCSIGNTTIGEHSYVADFAIINNTQIGKFCSIGPGLRCGLGAHPHDFISSSPFFYNELNTTDQPIFNEYEDTRIGNDVWIGANVFIKDGVTIGDGAILAAGSVILKDVEPYTIVGGVPAKLIRYRHSEEVISFLKNLKWWDRDPDWLKTNRAIFQKKIIEVDDLNGLTV